METGCVQKRTHRLILTDAFGLSSFNQEKDGLNQSRQGQVGWNWWGRQMESKKMGWKCALNEMNLEQPVFLLLND